MNASTLNQVAELLGTTDKNLVFSAIIKALVERGMNVSDAFNLVFGEGAYKKFSNDIYTMLKSA